MLGVASFATSCFWFRLQCKIYINTYIKLIPDFLSNLEWWALNKIYERLNSTEKSQFLKILDKLISLINFNSFHYNLRCFYEKNKIKYDKKKIEKHINKLRI